MVAGVCAGLARYTGVDVTLVRLGFAAVSLFGGAGVAAYLICWLLVPDEGADASAAERYLAERRAGRSGPPTGPPVPPRPAAPTDRPLTADPPAPAS